MRAAAHIFYSGYQLYGVAQLLQAGHNAARVHHVARAHGQEERILPLGLQILRRCGNHAGVPLGEQLGVELVIAVEDGLFVVDLRQGIGVPVLPGVEHGGNLLLLGLGQRRPVASEEKYISDWMDKGFPPETVALAYDKTVFYKKQLEWRYLNGILRRWHENGWHTPEEVQQGDAKKSAAPPDQKPDKNDSRMGKYMKW